MTGIRKILLLFSPGVPALTFGWPFYTASNGVMLVSPWMSKGEEYRGQMGSRLVRRVKGPNNIGDIFVIRHNLRGGFASYPMYTESPDGKEQVKAFAWYTRDNGMLTSYDMFGLHGSSKCWAQKTQDGRFTVVGNSAGELFKR